MPTIVEIGPSNASQGQHRRKDATEQIKNLTLAGSRTQVPGFSSNTNQKHIMILILIISAMIGEVNFIIVEIIGNFFSITAVKTAEWNTEGEAAKML